MTAIDSDLNNYRSSIAAKVRQLRTERLWSQSELADRLGLSQSRLSEIERGGGSFTAEQFLVLLRLFNVSVSQFVDDQGTSDTQLQNALVRLGAAHLRESDGVVPSERFDSVNRVVLEVLIDGSARLVTALAPVLVANADHVGLHRIQSELSTLGLARRLGWLADNVKLAILEELSEPLHTVWRKQYQRAELQLEHFLGTIERAALEDSRADILDASIRSSSTLAETTAHWSPTSRKWNVITALTPANFAQALRAARDDV